MTAEPRQKDLRKNKEDEVPFIFGSFTKSHIKMAFKMEETYVIKVIISRLATYVVLHSRA